MKPNYLLMLPLTLSSVLFMTACNRAPVPVEPAPPADSPMAAEPAPAPMTPADTAPVAPAMMDSGMSFADMDKNSDGGITHDEVSDTEMLGQHFTMADTDGDGKLSQAEVDKHRADMAAMPGG